MRRLRQHAPHVRIVVGLWPTGDERAADAARRQAIGADVYVGSLREAVELICVTAPEAALNAKGDAR